MIMKTFADIKRALTKGKSLTMLRHDWIPNNNAVFCFSKQSEIKILPIQSIPLHSAIRK